MNNQSNEMELKEKIRKEFPSLNIEYLNKRTFLIKTYSLDLLNFLYGYDSYLKKDFKTALKYFHKSEFKYSYYFQGLIYSHDFIGNERNYEKAINCFFLSLDKTNEKIYQKYALFQIGQIYFHNHERKLAKIYFEASELEEANYYLEKY